MLSFTSIFVLILISCIMVHNSLYRSIIFPPSPLDSQLLSLQPRLQPYPPAQLRPHFLPTSWWPLVYPAQFHDLCTRILRPLLLCLHPSPYGPLTNPILHFLRSSPLSLHLSLSPSSESSLVHNSPESSLLSTSLPFASPSPSPVSSSLGISATIDPPPTSINKGLIIW